MPATDNTMERLIYLYCKFYLQDDILVKVDRASMACALEARAPFLDYTFVEFANAIPFGLKLKGLKTKYILKRAMAGKLPPDILARGKKGFGIPDRKMVPRRAARPAAGHPLRAANQAAGPFRLPDPCALGQRAPAGSQRQPQATVDGVYVPTVV